MNAIQLQILAGPIAGRRMTFAQSPISFGRDADNTLILLDSTVSRHHGELRFEGDRWILVNRSPNGTRLNRRNVTDKPAAVGNQDTVYIGDQPVFQITFPESAAPAVAADGPPVGGTVAGSGQATGGPGAATGPVKVPLSRKASTWAWIGISFGVILLVLYVMLGPSSQPNVGPQAAVVTELTPTQIANEISRPLPPPKSVDLERANHALEKARRAYPVPRTTPERLFDTYRAFQEYLAYSGQDRLTGDDELHFREIQEKLISEVAKQYQAACALVSSPDRAHDEFRKVQRLYNDPSSEISKNAEAHISKALAEQAARKHGLF